MDTIKKEKINKLKNNLALVYKFLDNLDDDENIKYLKMQHEMTESDLISLGVLDKNKDKLRIKELNEQLRELELSVGKDITEEHTASYILNSANTIESYFESEYGLKVSCNIYFSGHGATVNLDHIDKVKSVTSWEKYYYESDQELETENKRRHEIGQIADKFFTFSDNNKGNHILFTDENIKTLEFAINKIAASHFKHSINQRIHTQGSLCNTNRKELTIQSAKINIGCSATAKSLHNAFKGR